ncbi:MAG: rhodanese-like domain-containing protein [Chthoniobacterales bacterium]
MELANPLPRRVRKANARLGVIVTALIVLVAGYGVANTSAFQWFLLQASLQSRFPNVQWITAPELADWLQDRQRQPPILLDVRSEAEWNVSHLPGARRVDPGAPVGVVAPALPKRANIVTYCAVGYRSGDLATHLRAAGFTNVKNLDGGIFEWANEHRPLVRNGEPVSRVHPYNEFWGRLLSKDVRAP